MIVVITGKMSDTGRCDLEYTLNLLISQSIKNWIIPGVH